MTIAIALHAAAAVIWVGGMFFAHMFFAAENSHFLAVCGFQATCRQLFVMG